MRIMDWSASVCSSYLGRVRHARIVVDVDLVDVWQIRIAERGDIDGIARSAIARLIVRRDDVDAVVTRDVGEGLGKAAREGVGRGHENLLARVDQRKARLDRTSVV